jgi:O-antigen ligase
MSLSRVVRLLFFATLFSVTFEKVHWEVAGTVELADILAVLFLVAYAFERVARCDRRLPRTGAAALGFATAFLLVYLVGYFNLDSSQGESQFGKGMVKFGIHFLFLIAGIAYLARRSERFYFKALGAFFAGMVFNSIYGAVQLVLARGGINLDHAILAPLTGGASNINIYGRIGGTQAVYRINALTGDPNHLGIMLDIPLLVLTPLYLRLARGHPWKTRLAVVIGFLLLAEIATLSRSGILGLIVGAAILALPYRRQVGTRAFLLPLTGAAAVLALVVLTRLDYFERILRSRVQTGGNSTSAHFGVYDFIPKIIHSHPLFGLGLNTFSVYYEQVTGLTNWGPHSFYVALVVETGLVGAALFATFLWYVFRRLRAARAIGRALSALGDPVAAQVRPLAWGMTAALAGTMAANAFYLTMSFYYFYAFALLALATPVVFGRRVAPEPAPAGLRLREAPAAA